MLISALSYIVLDVILTLYPFFKFILSYFIDAGEPHADGEPGDLKFKIRVLK